MTDNYIQIGKGNLLTLKIKTEDGVDTGETLVFDLEDVELILKCQEVVERNKKNKEWYANQLSQIQSRKDIKGKKLLSKNEEDIVKATKEFFDRVADTFNIFLGENGVQKLLYGRKPSMSSLLEVEDIIVTQIQPLLEKNMTNIMEKLKDKYSKKPEKEIEEL